MTFFCWRCCSHHETDSCPPAPRVTWTVTSKPETIVSADNIVRFTVTHSGDVVTAEANWWPLPFNLAPDASKRIFNVSDRAGVKSVGGGRSCLRIRATGEAWNQIRGRIAAILANPENWQRIERHSNFSPVTIIRNGSTDDGEWDFAQLVGDEEQEMEI